jgi:ubiquinol-cytochrome c reductase iron-sulfur subunit
VADTAVQSGSGNSPEPADQNRRDFIHIAAAVGAGGAAVSLAWPLVDQMNPAGDPLAMASIEYDVSKVGLGQEITIKWRGKPVFIRHRTPEEIAKARADDHADLRDPQTDAARVKPGHEDMLILVGVCTHLGCVPLFGQGEYNGWFCPCHGSVYDTSGRIRKGPAPKNLEVPDYSFRSPTRVKIG